jgi:hypothetical protein
MSVSRQKATSIRRKIKQTSIHNTSEPTAVRPVLQNQEGALFIVNTHSRSQRTPLQSVFWLENQKGRDHSEDLRTDGKIIRMDLRETRWEGVDWMHLAQDRDQ